MMNQQNQEQKQKQQQELLSQRATVHVTITSDLGSPWCWVGLKYLQKASKQSNINISIEYKPYLLRPNIPDEGLQLNDGTNRAVPKYLKDIGKSVDIHFTGVTSDRIPNTILFHSVLKLLQETNEDENTNNGNNNTNTMNDGVDKSHNSRRITSFYEAVFEGYYTHGIYPNKDGILDAARKVSNDNNDNTILVQVRELFTNDRRMKLLKKQVLEESMDAASSGIHGVPSFHFNGIPVFQGVQPVEKLVSYLRYFAAATTTITQKIK